MKNLIEAANITFRQYRKNFIQNMLESVMFENDDVTKKISDLQNTRPVF